MVRSRLSPREIVQRLQMIETLTGEGLPVAEALRSVGIGEAEYDRWRVEYSGLRRTLGPLLCPTTKLAKSARRAAPARPRKPSL
jgi:putative transposase